MKYAQTISIVCLVGSAAILSGCVSDQAARYYASEKYPARPSTEVEVLFKKPERTFDLIADFQARGASIDYMRREAAKIGADAVIVTLLGGYRSESDQWASQDNYSTSYSRIAGSAIRYK